MRALNIAVDARLWGAYWTGTASYLRGITRALAQSDSVNRYTLVTAPWPQAEPAVRAPNFQEMVLDRPHIMEELWEQVTFPTDLAARGVQLLFAPGSIVPAARDFTAIPVVHDLGFIHHPEFYNEGLRTYLTKWVGVACGTADLIVCNSAFTGRSVMETYAVSSERCRTIYPAPDAAFTPEGDEEERARLGQQYGLDGPYVLAVSSGGQNKNLPGALGAMALVWTNEKELDHQLVIVGRSDLPDSAEGQQEFSEWRGRVRTLGRVPMADLVGLYRCADLFVFPSLFEGFGLPPVEAMACGTPVVASDRASLPEALGDAALLCDPEDREAMAEAIVTVLCAPELQESLRQKGLKHVSQFSWLKSAQTLARLFQEVA